MNRRLMTYPLVAFAALVAALLGKLADLDALGRYGLGAGVLVVSLGGLLVWSEGLLDSRRKVSIQRLFVYDDTHQLLQRRLSHKGRLMLPLFGVRTRGKLPTVSSKARALGLALAAVGLDLVVTFSGLEVVGLRLFGWLGVLQVVCLTLAGSLVLSVYERRKRRLKRDLAVVRADIFADALAARYNIVNELHLSAAEASERHAAAGGDSEAAYRLSLLLELRGDRAGARRVWQRMEAAWRLNDEDGDPRAASHLGNVLAERGDLDSARAAWERAAERGDNEAWLYLGVLFANQGDIYAARSALRHCDDRRFQLATRHLHEAFDDLTTETSSSPDAEESY